MGREALHESGLRGCRYQHSIDFDPGPQCFGQQLRGFRKCESVSRGKAAPGCLPDPLDKWIAAAGDGISELWHAFGRCARSEGAAQASRDGHAPAGRRCVPYIGIPYEAVPFCERIPVECDRPAPETVRRAAAAIRRGALVAAPTDTLYGLLADALNPQAVSKLFRAKGRPESKPILLLIDSFEALPCLVGTLPAAFAPLAQRFWPGPLTLVLPADARVPEAVTAGTGTVAVRLPSSSLVRDLARRAKCPLTGTSANRSGRIGARSGREVARQLGSRVRLVLDAGPVSRPEPSTILDLCSDEPRILRPGRIRLPEIQRALGSGLRARA